jgi:IS30 family transposase
MKTTIKKILEIACNSTGNTIDELISNNRSDYISESRYIFARLARNERYSLEEIGLASNRDHSTISHRLKQHENQISVNKYYTRCYYESEQELNDYKNGYITETKEEIIDTPYGKRKAQIIIKYHKDESDL